MKINAILCLSCGDIIYSRTRHDFHWCSCGTCAIDGGLDYTKVVGDPKNILVYSFNLDVTKEELFNDWNKNIDKYGVISAISGKKNKKATQELIDAANNGDLAKAKQALLDGADPKAVDSQALRLAANYGKAECVKLLIPVSDPKALDSWALRFTAEHGHADCVRLLIPVSDPKALDSQALRWAASKGHAECVKLLIPVSDPKAINSLALRWAAKNGHADCVRLLIPVSDPKVVQELKPKIKKLGIDIDQSNHSKISVITSFIPPSSGCGTITNLNLKNKNPLIKKYLAKQFPEIWKQHISISEKMDKITKLLQ